MAFLKCTFLFVALFALVAASPIPEPEPGFWGPKHEHIVVHVPYNVHTVHHHHVHKVPIPIVKAVPIVKEVPIIKEVHYSKPYIHDHHDHHLDHHLDHHIDHHHGWW